MKKYDYLILGASGMQGRIVARDLLEKGNKVLLTDIFKEGSQKNLKNFLKADFRYLDVRKFRKMIATIRKSGANMVINCAESDWNLKVHKACLIAGVHVIDLDSDISTTEKQLALDSQFKKKGLTAITGCGSTPGINNIMLNYAQKQFDSITTVNLGFAWDSNMETFVVPFSIPSIVWEFTQPATVLESGKFGFKKPLSERVNLNLHHVGEQTCYLVEHTEVYTFKHYLKNRGLKNMHFYAGFPKHSSEIILGLIQLGLTNWGKVPIDGGLKISPMDLTNEVLRKIEYPKGYTEIENLWVEIIGDKNDQPKRIFMECVVPPLPNWEDAGCNVDTGFPASIIAQMIKDGRITERGSFAPEAVVPEEEFFKELADKKIVVYQDGVALNAEPGSLPIVPGLRKTQQAEVFV